MGQNSFSRIFNSSENPTDIFRAKEGIKDNGSNAYIQEKMDKSKPPPDKGTHVGYEVNFDTGTVTEFAR